MILRPRKWPLSRPYPHGNAQDPRPRSPRVDLAPVTLRGPHVLLEPLRREHARELWPPASEPEIWLYMRKAVRTPEDLAAWIDERVKAEEAGKALPFLQRDARTGAAFGSTSIFDCDREMRTCEIGHTWIGASHRRTPANTEAKLLLLTHAFDALGMNRVQLKTDARNVRSRRAIERIGAVHEGIVRKHMVTETGYVRDSALYSIVAGEWPDVRRRLEGLLAAPHPPQGKGRPPP